MKKITFILLILLTTGTAFAQTQATATADAVIITALKIVKVDGADLNFGTIAPKSDAATTFSVSNIGSVGGDATDMVVNDHQVASFTITGDSNQSIDLTVTPPTTLGDGAGNTIGFTVDQSLTNGIHALTGGTLTLNIGGELNLAANQAAGSYTGEITVDVSYE